MGYMYMQVHELAEAVLMNAHNLGLEQNNYKKNIKKNQMEIFNFH